MLMDINVNWTEKLLPLIEKLLTLGCFTVLVLWSDIERMRGWSFHEPLCRSQYEETQDTAAPSTGGRGETLLLCSCSCSCSCKGQSPSYIILCFTSRFLLTSVLRSCFLQGKHISGFSFLVGRVYVFSRARDTRRNHLVRWFPLRLESIHT